MSLADKITARLAEKAKERDKAAEDARERARQKAAYLKLREDRQREKEEELARILANAEVERQRLAEEERLRIIAHKTKEYYSVDKFSGALIPLPGEPKYFGDWVGTERILNKPPAWTPQGEGEFSINQVVQLQGNWEKGVLHGNGMAMFEESHMKWEGEFKMGKIHGVGFLTDLKTGVRKEALARNDIILCFKDELQDGKQIEINDAKLRIVGETPNARVTILSHVKNWLYRVRYQDQLQPRDCNLDFSSIRRFRILHHLPQIYHLTKFGVQSEASKRYDYYFDTYGPGNKPRLGVAVGRRNPEMRFVGPQPLYPQDRKKTLRNENIFETEFLGFGKAKEEEENRIRREQKKIQWAKLIEERREKEEEDKQKRIEEDQKAFLDDQMSKQKEKDIADRALKEAEQKEIDDAIAAEQARWDSKEATY